MPPNPDKDSEDASQLADKQVIFQSQQEKPASPANPCAIANHEAAGLCNQTNDSTGSCRSNDHLTHLEHLKVCTECREHEIEAYKSRIKHLEKLSKSGGKDDDKDPLRQAELKREIKLTRIPAGRYREVKTWGPNELGDASVLLYTSDGGGFIRREPRRALGLTAAASSGTELNSGAAAGPLHDDIPFRLIFNSVDLMEMLETITEDEISQSAPVHVRPFKYLLTHEAKIRAALEALKVACRGLESGQKDRTSEEKASENDNTHHAPAALEAAKVMGVKVSERNVKLLECLMGFVDDQMHDIISLRKQVAARTLPEIAFENLSHLYEPGDLVIGDPQLEASERRAYRVLYVTSGRPLIESIEERQQRLKDKYKEIINEIGGFEIFGDDFVSQGQHGKATKMTPLVIDCFYMDYDGVSYGPRPQRFIIPEYNGCKKITELDVFPLEFDPACNRIRQALHKRGEAFINCVTGSHKEYHGVVLPEKCSIMVDPSRDYLAYIQSESGTKSEVFQLDCECVVDQRSMIDAYSPNRDEEFKGCSQTNKLGFHTGVVSRPTDSMTSEHFDRLKKTPGITDMDDDSKFDLNRRTQFVRRTNLLTKGTTILEQQIELLPLRVFGYALQQRKWCALNVLHLTDPQAMQESKRHTAFDNLVLDPKHKKTIQALISYQVGDACNATYTTSAEYNSPGSGRIEDFDLIRGKGRGLVILLHGAPGVGKTSTAESVAIQLQRPLLPITCGDLGQDPSDVERNLEKFFALGAKWRCVVLLDEADVFLARRVTGDLHRNSLVSVFLRQMEYYPGVLILTTNRVGEFDEAFVSRIHMKLHFPHLDERSTMEVWDMNLRRLKTSSHIEIKAKAIRKFAEEYWQRNQNFMDRQWNGRQIKNAFQTAVALAYWDWEGDKADGKHKEKPTLRKSHFEDVANTSQHFEEYMDQIYGTVGPNGRRRKGALAREAEKLRIRYDDRGAAWPEQRSTHTFGGVNATAAMPAASRPSQTPEAVTMADLQRQIAELKSAQAAQTLHAGNTDAGADESESDSEGDEEDSDDD